ncbi:TIGR01459 family HAD-type hydrolase [Bartonella ancashensis]|uniref:HAD superfamily protein involved in N-acetyl-glucosamine catabolism n=1 Tax=Bartonella ancashensis TaxID=1318743 RepID=A0A0M4LIQ3_9HYPH|nr:TIGR01459 family HAD-type hydrolase [Bartonella ancashensis]ALE02989.1 HAD superfamily protein involved in N-acetyl-glucosamine catabolism [Bartonella ancashensis]
MKELTYIAPIMDNYDAVFCDIWGVIHDGTRVFEPALKALQTIRKMGKHVVLLTNSPRQRQYVITQLQQLNVDSEYYDAVVTSGDVTRDLIHTAPCQVFFIGPRRDLSLFEGLSCEITGEDEARTVVCSGFLEEIGAIPQDYEELFKRLCKRNLPFICANPDIMVYYGDQQVWCAGALARLYQQLGGEVHIAGKPHALIYSHALKILNNIGGPVNKSRILAIGDGLLTDVKGAICFGIDVVYIVGGIHRHNYLHDGLMNKEALYSDLDRHGYKPKAIMWAFQ